MAETTKIEWTDATFNPWRGCERVSPACDNCYAAAMAKRNPAQLGVWSDGGKGTRVVASESKWKEPLTWDRKARDAGEKRLVFCASLADLFEDREEPMLNPQGDWLHVCDSCINPDGSSKWAFCRPRDALGYYECGCGEQLRQATMADVRKRLFDLIDRTPNLVWQLLTKRPENIRRMWPVATTNMAVLARHGRGELFRDNVWLGTTVEDQQRAEDRIVHLTQCRELASVLFLSCEPLLGPLDLRKWTTPTSGSQWQVSGGPNECRHGIAAGIHCGDCNRVDWVIAGGESGPNARSCHPGWIRDLRDQCAEGGVPFFFKQWGEWAPVARGKDPYHIHDEYYSFMSIVGKKAAGATLDGCQYREFPVPKVSDV